MIGVRSQGRDEGKLKRKIAILALCALLLALCSSVEAQQPKKFFKIGVLFIGGRDQPHLEAFKQGLRELGYTEDKNITFEYRYAEGKEDRLPGLAAELVHLKADVIVVTSDVGAQAVQQATKTLPIVVTTGDPITSGLADSLAKPGGNVTGLSVLLADLSGKRVEILRETFPKLTRLATLWNPAKELRRLFLKKQAQLRKLFLCSFIPSRFRHPKILKRRLWICQGASQRAFGDLESFGYASLEADCRDGAQATLAWHVSHETICRGRRAHGVRTAHRRFVPPRRDLRGQNPQRRQARRLPVEQPTKFEFIINLKAAKQIGLTIPPNVLARADRVIK